MAATFGPHAFGGSHLQLSPFLFAAGFEKWFRRLTASCHFPGARPAAAIDLIREINQRALLALEISEGAGTKKRGIRWSLYGGWFG